MINVSVRNWTVNLDYNHKDYEPLLILLETIRPKLFCSYKYQLICHLCQVFEIFGRFSNSNINFLNSLNHPSDFAPRQN